jgi:penicillin-binding protein 1A
MNETLRRLAKRILWITVVLAVVATAAGALGYWVLFDVLPKKDPGQQFTKENITQILSGETRVLYRDGKKVLGAFFDVNHRLYVPYDSIPPAIVNALVAAEDSRYWKHNGFDPKGFARAMLANIKAGSMRQGGSTLTQQAAKNIFGREERSIAAKWKELQDALRLEKNFSKQEILEFYLNQFHVSGTGRGVAIAAQYFFSKDLGELTLAECAFIAGSVKGPFNYDPFIQKNQERRDKALDRGRTRLRYVLGRMLEEDMITQQQYAEALARPLDFKHGQFRFNLSSTLSRIEEKLNDDFYRELFEKNGITNWQKEQLEIVTTLDAGYQDAARSAVQQNISQLQVRLGGFILPAAKYPDRALKARPGDYLYGSVDSVQWTAEKRLKAIYLSFGQVLGKVDAKELDTLAARVQNRPELLLQKRLVRGNVLLVRVLDSVAVTGRYPCRIETEPQLQGGLIAIQEGEVLASQSGFHNTGYDRTFQAVRQFGSSWKPLLYALALHHGWHYLDELENGYNLFQYNDRFYFPRPDHEDRALQVSIAWAAVRSENIASIWLLEHLLDKLPDAAMHDVAALHGYLRKEDEGDTEYFARLRDSLGLTLRESAKQEIEFERAKTKLLTDLVLEGQLVKARSLRALHYGNYVDAEMKRQARSGDIRALLAHNYLRYAGILRERLAQEAKGATELPPADSVTLFDNFTLADYMRLASAVEPVAPDKDYLSEANLFRWPDFRRSLGMAEFARFAKQIGVRRDLQEVQSMPLGVNDVSLADITTAYQSILEGFIYKCADGEWSEPCLIKEIRDRNGKVLFRNSVEKQRVLSDTVTAQMAVMLRAVFTYGTGRSAVNDLVLTPTHAAGSPLRFPALGKTGTTNDYRNVAFMGGLPTYDSTTREFGLQRALAIGSYIGFDDNRQLKGNSVRIAGASGALPQWSQFAQRVTRLRQDAQQVDFLDLALVASGEVSLALPALKGEIAVGATSGLPIQVADSTAGIATLPWMELTATPAPSASAEPVEEEDGGFF